MEITESGGVIKILPVYHYLGTLFTGGLQMKYQKEHIDFAYKKLYSLYSATQTNVFICGKSAEDNNSIRASLQKQMNLSSKINVILPEWLFSSSSTAGLTILDHEQMLAKNVDYIIIVLESPGAICELGAFASSKELLGKILVLIENEHAYRKSFITQGPIKSIKKENANANAIFIYSINNSEKAILDVYKKIVFAHNLTKVNKDIHNIFNLSRLIGYAIGLLQPIKTIELKNVIKEWEPKLAIDHVEPAIEILSKNGHVFVDRIEEYEMVSLTPEGNSHFIFQPSGQKNISKKVTSIRSDNLWRRFRNKNKLNLEGELQKLLESGQ